MLIIPTPIVRKPPEPRTRRWTLASANANLIEVLLLNSGALLLEFDGPVNIDPDNPPTTWSFNHISSIQAGVMNYGQSAYLILNGIVNSGQPVVFLANDPAARTPGGGYVNAVNTVISDR